MDYDLKFFGRNDQLLTLKKRVLDLKDGYRQNIALLGNQYVGKSSILQHFLTNLDDHDITPVYLDLENKDFDSFLHKFIGSLLYNFSQNKHLTLHEDIQLLLESVKTHIPHTVDVIKKILHEYERNKIHEAFLGLITLPEVFTNESKQYCLLILDEFQNLEDFDIPHIFQTLGKKVMTQKRCLYIVVSSRRDAAEKILSEKLSLLFGNFESIEVEPFDFQHAHQFIERLILPNKMGVQLKNFLADFTGGHPLYLQLICQEMVHLSAVHQQSEIYFPILSQSVENTIFNRWGVLSRHFELTVEELTGGKGNRPMFSILMSLANGKCKMLDIISSAQVSKHQFNQKINSLLERGIVVKNGGFYYLKDKLFKYWMKYIYQKRIKNIELTFDKQKRQFKEEFNLHVESFKANSRKDFSVRVVELLHCFDNEAFQMNGRKYLLPVFKDIIPLKLKDESGYCIDAIKATTNKNTWMIVLKKESLAENELNMALAEVKRWGKRPERMVMISLNNLDENTKLRALQERFWIWNESELNTLLTLFDKPYII